MTGVNVLAHRTTDSKRGWSVLCGGALVGVCLCCWRSVWIVAHSGVVLIVGGIGWYQNDEGVPPQRVTKHENLALNEARLSWS